MKTEISTTGKAHSISIIFFVSILLLGIIGCKQHKVEEFKTSSSSSFKDTDTCTLIGNLHNEGLQFVYNYFDSIGNIDTTLTRAEAFSYLKDAINKFIDSKPFFSHPQYVKSKIVSDSSYYEPILDSNYTTPDIGAELPSDVLSRGQNYYLNKLDSIVDVTPYDYLILVDNLYQYDSLAQENLSSGDYNYIVGGAFSVTQASADYHNLNYTDWQSMFSRHYYKTMRPVYSELIDADGQGALSSGIATLATGQVYLVPEAMVAGGLANSSANLVGQLMDEIGLW